MTNFEYYVAGNRANEGWHEFLTNYKNEKGADRAIDQYNKWLLEEYDPHILDDIEKKYLSNVIKPFRNRVASISKQRDCANGSNFVYFIDIKIDGENDYCALPNFKPNTGMYKNMEANRKYTLKELGL